MNEFATRLSAELMATLHVLGARLERTKEDRGQAAAEYIGILVFVALVVMALVTFKDGIAGEIKAVISSAITKIGQKLGA